MNVVRPPGGRASKPRRPSPSRERFERLYRTIRDRICLFEYPPGGRLSEEELAAEFSVSRTPVRRVLARLEAEGLIEARHGVGHIVARVELTYFGQRPAALPDYMACRSSFNALAQALSASAPRPSACSHRTPYRRRMRGLPSSTLRCAGP